MGDATAQYRLAGFYQNGWGVTVDFEIAALWLRRAADQGQHDAQFNLGADYLDGSGVEADREEAKRWFERSAEQGYSAAEYKLGWLTPVMRIPAQT